MSSCTNGFKSNNKSIDLKNAPTGFECGSHLSPSLDSETVHSLNSPAHFTVTARNDTTISLSWDSVPEAVGYVLKRNGTIIY